MSDWRIARLVDLGVLAAATALAWPGLQRLGDDAGAILAFATAVAVVEFFDVELPRGDASTMSVPVVILAVFYLSPTGAILVTASATILALLAGRRARDVATAIPVLVRRIFIASLGTALVSPLEQAILDELASALALAFLLVAADFLLAQAQTASRRRIPLLQLVGGGSRMQGTIMAAKVASAALAVVIYPEMGIWALLVLVMMLLVMRQAFSLFVSVRRAYQSTIGALARTVEAQRPGKLGHAERASDLATEVGRQLGLRSRDLERLAYATLLHDLAVLGEHSDAADSEGAVAAADMLSSVDSLSDIVPILAYADGLRAPVRDSGDADLLLAYVVLVASRTDDLAAGESTDRDTEVIESLSGVLATDDQWRVEAAFRRAAVRVQQPLFVSGPGGLHERDGVQ